MLSTGLVLGCVPYTEAEDGGSDTGYTPTGTADAPGEFPVRQADGQQLFMVGLGNDLPPNAARPMAFDLTAPPPLHYLYLVGLPGRGGWPSWNEGGRFIDRQAAEAASHGVVPAFTLYAMAEDGEGNPDTIADATYMAAWWDGYTLALERLASFDHPALLHVEPDLWGFLQKYGSDSPHDIPAVVGSEVAACSDLPDTVAGFGRCVVRQARAIAPNVHVGFHASRWADPDIRKVAAFMAETGAADADLLFVETLDRDAGCFEVQAEGCTRDDGPWYWPVSEKGTPDFDAYLDDMAVLGDGVDLPLVFWQMPMGVPSEAAGGQPGQYRDTRVKHFFETPEAYAAAGGVAVLFGPGWTGQTDLSSDGGQFEGYWNAWRKAPLVLEP